MTRKEFLAKLGMGAAFALTCTCLNSCKDDDNEPGPVDFTIDLTQSEFATLNVNGTYVITNDTVIARAMDGSYLAATVVCSHEEFKQITYRDNQGTEEWFCTKHGARYDLQGNGLNEEGQKGLRIYNTTLSGDMLRVFS